jgi:hypothetical protein
MIRPAAPGFVVRGQVIAPSEVVETHRASVRALTALGTAPTYNFAAMKLSVAAGCVVVAGLLLLGLAGPAHRLGLPLGSAFAMVRWSAYIALAGAALSLAVVFWSRRKSRKGATAVASIGLVAGILTAAIGYGWLRVALNAPLLHDVSTDLENPPVFEAVLAHRPESSHSLVRTREVDLLQRQHYPDLAPLVIPQPARLVFDRARLVADNQGWTIVASDPAAGRIEATDTTKWFGFTDDIVVRLTAWGTGTRVDIRSASRSGATDTGTNARRVQRFLAALQQP